MRVVIDFIVFSRGEYRLVFRDNKNRVLVWLKVLKLHKILGKKALKHLIDTFHYYSYPTAISTEQFKNGGYTILWEKEIEIKDINTF